MTARYFYVQNTITYYGYVYFLPKIYLILFSCPENWTTHITILYNSKKVLLSFFVGPLTLPKVPIFFISFSVGLFSSLRNRAVEWTSKSYLSVHIDVLQCHFLLLNICQRNLREKKLATLCHYHRNKPSQTFGHVCHQINTRMDKSEL